MTTLQTHSYKNIISTNGLLENSSFTELPEDDRHARWKWARTSEEVQTVKRKEKEFVENVKTMKKLSLVKKEENKKKKVGKMLKALENCKVHGGPVTPSTIEWLDRLNVQQLLTEISYIRLTSCPDIRQKRRIKAPDGKFRFQTFTAAELRQSIRSAIKPESDVVDNLDELIKVALSKRA